MTSKAVFAPEMMEESRQHALMAALERVLDCDALESAWPAAFDCRKAGNAVPPCEVRIVVLPLDRIGAPPGASGAGVYIAYYTHTATSGPALLASPPLVVKIGDTKKLTDEMTGAKDWPTLSSHEAERFARPIHLDVKDPDCAVLVAPFRSMFSINEQGTRNTIEVRDLWQLLKNDEELRGASDEHWVRVEKCVSEALDAVHSPHRSAYGQPLRESQSYQAAYEWYLRGTTDGAKKRHIPNLVFGSAPELQAFGRTWANPIPLVEELMKNGEFSGCVGAIHGDLHPKNIVLNHENAARIIDFGWARRHAHIVQDYLLLDLNLRGVTLPSQLAEGDLLALAGFLRPSQDFAILPKAVRKRGEIIQKVIWKKALDRAVTDWKSEYLVPLLLVSYGLLVYLDSARNQPALVATVLSATQEIRKHGSAVVA